MRDTNRKRPGAAVPRRHSAPQVGGKDPTVPPGREERPQPAVGDFPGQPQCLRAECGQVDWDGGPYRLIHQLDTAIQPEYLPLVRQPAAGQHQANDVHGLTQSLRDALFDARQSLDHDARRRWSLFVRLARELEPELGPGQFDTAFGRRANA